MEKPEQQQFLTDCNSLIMSTPHKNLLDFHGVCLTADWMYIVIEDVTYNLKKKLLESGENNVPPGRISSLTEEYILRVIWEIADVMEYLSSKKVSWFRLTLIVYIISQK